jgi:hypothetical protein
MKVAHSSITSTDAPHASGDNDPVIPRIPRPRKPSGLAPRPAPPRQQLTARMAPLLRDLDWTRPADEPTTYDTVVLGYGEPAWKTAFGSAA